MAEHDVQRELEALVELARRAEPAPMGPREARRRARAALAVPAQRSWFTPRFKLALACAAALFALSSSYALLRRPAGTRVAVGAADRPLRLELRSGDALVLAPGSELAVLEQAAPQRRVRLLHGSALFDVAKLGAGAGFEVQTASARVRVLGTIFSVEVASGRTLVRVYEGRVAAGEQLLRAPAVWSSRGELPDLAGGAFAHEASQLARARGAAARAAAPTADGLAPASAHQVTALQPDEPAAAAPPSTSSAQAAREVATGAGTPGARAEPAFPESMRASGAREAASGADPGRAGVGTSEPRAAPASGADPGGAGAGTSEPRAARASGADPGRAGASASDARAESSSDQASGAERGASDEPRPPQATAAVRFAPPAELAAARALLAGGQAEAALQLVQPYAAFDDAALLISADALRALELHRDAAAQYRWLARRSAGSLRAGAAFAAAQLAFHALREPAESLALIRSFALLARDCPLRERAAALEVDALLALGQRAQAQAAARRYLAREPETETSQRMRALARE